MPTKMVLDTNYREDPELSVYLSKRSSNFVVLTDYFAMEAYNSASVKDVIKSMEILSAFPKQVIVLKPTINIATLRGRKSGLARRMIDQSASAEFKEFCASLELAKSGNVEVIKSIIDHQDAAKSHLDEMISDMNVLVTAFDLVQKTFSASEIKKIRRKETNSEILSKTMKIIHRIEEDLRESHPHPVKNPLANEYINTFIFRYTIGVVYLNIEWIGSGSNNLSNIAKLRNDIVDVNFATYATYFDGILTKDNKLLKTYSRMRGTLDIFEKISQRQNITKGA